MSFPGLISLALFFGGSLAFSVALNNKSLMLGFELLLLLELPLAVGGGLLFCGSIPGGIALAFLLISPAFGLDLEALLRLLGRALLFDPQAALSRAQMTCQNIWRCG